MIAGEWSGLERKLAVRVIDTLLREDYAGLSRRIRLHRGGQVLDLPSAQGGAGLVLPLEHDGFLADLKIRKEAERRKRLGLPPKARHWFTV